MGIHGLTTFLNHLEKTKPGNYREGIIIRDKPVVIDGCNLMYHLYFSGRTPVVGKGNKSITELDGKMSPSAHLYGGDWMHYAQNVRYFFQHLKHCGIVAVVLFDGAYDTGKLKIARYRFSKTVAENVRARTGSSVEEPGSTYTPVFLKSVFIEVLKEQKVAHYQTVGEADPTIAMVAKMLSSCVILSSDSDFYIYEDAKPVSLATLNFVQKQPKAENTDGKKDLVVKGKSAKVWVLQGEHVSLTKICEKEYGLKNQEMFPLAAVIIGNDSIMSPGIFKDIKHGDSIKNKIESVLKWLAKQKTVGSAFKSLLASVPEEKRKLVGAALVRNLEMYTGDDGEKRVWDRIKEGIDVSRWVDQTMENKIYKSTVSENNISQKMESLTVTLGQEGRIKCIVHQDSKKSESVKNEIAKITCDRNGNLQADVVTRAMPEWYRVKHINCEFQTYLLNILKNKVVFLPPQVEMRGQPTTHDFCVPIIRATAGILLGDPDEVILLESFLDNGTPVRIKTSPITRVDNFGALFALKNHEKEDFTQYFTHEPKLSLMIAVLGICEKDKSLRSFYDGWPVSYRIWIATFMYYTKMKLYSHRGSFQIKKKIAIVSSIFLCIIKNLIYNPGKISDAPANNCLKAISALLNVTNECPAKMKEVRDFYDRFEEYTYQGTKKNSKKGTYDISIPYSLCQYLCVVYHAEMLNNLLGNPLKSPKVRYTINNYFIYNLARYIESKIDGIDENFNANIKDVTGVEEIDEILHELWDFCYNFRSYVLMPDKSS